MWHNFIHQSCRNYVKAMCRVVGVENWPDVGYCFNAFCQFRKIFWPGCNLAALDV